ncbi:MAG: hypothetical protein KA419_20665 [Acidobacteria bacterium]|nr:hypothetical protein [Acidobacteriota bacterium]
MTQRPGIFVEFRLVQPKRNRRHLALGLALGLGAYLAVIGAQLFQMAMALKRLQEKFAFDVVDLADQKSPFDRSGAMFEPELEPPPRAGGFVQPGDEPKPPPKKKPPEDAGKDPKPPEAPKPRSPEAMSRLLDDWNTGVEKVRTLNVGPVKEQVARLYTLQKEGKIRMFPLSMEVSFRLAPDCSVTDIVFRKSSGFPEVDDVALRIIPEFRQLCLLLDLMRSDAITVRIGVDDHVAVELIYDAPDEELARLNMDDILTMKTALLGSLALLGKTRDVQYVMGIELERVGVHLIARSRVPRGDIEKLLLRFIGNPK